MKMKNLEATPEQKRCCVRRKRVLVRKHQVHDEMWNDLAEVTRGRILKLRPQPDGWCIYLNPEFTVESSEFSPEFSWEARRCQRDWIRAMNKTLKNKYRRQFARRSDYMTRQLSHNGVLLVNGHLITPHDWKSMEADINSHLALKNEQPDKASRSRGTKDHDNSSGETVFPRTAQGVVSGHEWELPWRSTPNPDRRSIP